MNVLDFYLAQNGEKALDSVHDLAINVINIVPKGTPNIEVITSMLIVVGSVIKTDAADGTLSSAMGEKLVADCSEFLKHYVATEFE